MWFKELSFREGRLLHVLHFPEYVLFTRQPPETLQSTDLSLILTAKDQTDTNYWEAYCSKHSVFGGFSLYFIC